MKYCNKCNFENNDENVFCSHCGNKLDGGMKECLNCHNKIPQEANFCPFCGASNLNEVVIKEKPKKDKVSIYNLISKIICIVLSLFSLGMGFSSPIQLKESNGEIYSLDWGNDY